MSISQPHSLRITKTATLTDPYFTAGEYAYLIGMQNGNFPDLGWHLTGEMGGLWAHSIKLIDGLWLRVDGSWLTEARRFTSGAFWSEHEYVLPDDLQMTRRQFIPDGEPMLVVLYTFRAPSDRTVQLRLLARSDLQGEWLASFEGVHDGYDHAAYDEVLHAWICHDDLNPWYVIVGVPDIAPHGHESGRDLWGPEITAGNGISVALDYELAVSAGQDTQFEVIVTGSHAGPVPAYSSFTHVGKAVTALWEAKEARYAELLARSVLDVPETAITRAWDWVKCNYDWLVRHIPPLGRGLGAGVPDYPWWFGCDNFFALRGCLALGRHDVAIDTLDLIRSVSIARNGESGRVIHECTTRGCVFNPGNTQETPHFIRAVWDTFLWTGDVEFLRRNYAFCKAGLLEWTLGANCRDGDVLPYGYGIVEINHLNLQCIDSAALTVEALSALAGMAGVFGEAELEQYCRQLHEVVKQRIEEAFWINEEGLYGDMVASPAEMAPRLRHWIEQAERPNHEGKTRPEAAAAFQRLLDEAESDPAQDRKRPWLCKNWILIAPLEGGLTPSEKAARLLDRVEGPEFSGRWGMYLSGIERSASMSINTGVLAVAELQYGRVDKALEYIHTIVETLDMHMPGAISEMSPDYGCCVQAWSGYGVAWPLVSQVFGLRPDALQRRLVLAHAFPSWWQEASLTGVCVGNNTFDFRWDGRFLHVRSHEPGWEVTSIGVPVLLEPDSESP